MLPSILPHAFLLMMLFSNLIALVGIAAVGVNGVVPQKQVLISYPQDTPESNLNSYKNAITDAGGQVLHDFNHFKYDLSYRKAHQC